MANILAVDDEEDMLETIAYNLERAGHTVSRARSASEALAQLEHTVPDLIISDIMMPGMDGLAFCHKVRERQKTALTPFLFVTAKDQPGDKYAGLRAGADDYVTKPFELSDLLARVNGRLEHRSQMTELESQMALTEAMWQDASEPEALKKIREQQIHIREQAQRAGYPHYQIPSPSAFALLNKVKQFERRFPVLAELRATTLIGSAPNFLRVFEEILIAATTPDPVLILGETGTGKTAIAEAIWRLGPRASAQFRTINCSELAAGDPTIANSKLFGLGKGSGLAGVNRDGQPGLLEEADGGVLFLDEVGDLPRQAQTLLLLPLEGRPFRPAVGTGADRRVDIKFVAATNRNIGREVASGGFPRDLYERFAGHVIKVPPLRERTQDIEALALCLLAQFEQQQALAPGAGISASASAALQAYAWPGNVRELRRVIRQAAQRARLDGRARIERRDLPDEIADGIPRERRSGTQQSVPLPLGVRFTGSLPITATGGARSTPADPPAWARAQPEREHSKDGADLDPVSGAPTHARLEHNGAEAASPSRPARGWVAADAPESTNPLDNELRAHGFSERELAELAALRACGFRVGEAEVRLGYSSKSRTFSHRLRGMSFKVLSAARFDVERAGLLLSGGDLVLAARASRRLRGLLDSLSTRAGRSEDKVLANLLHEHRPFALEALARARKRSPPSG